MLAKEDVLVIQALAKRGVYQRDIAETVGVHPTTVQRAVKRGGRGEPPVGLRWRRASSCRAMGARSRPSSAARRPSSPAS